MVNGLPAPSQGTPAHWGSRTVANLRSGVCCGERNWSKQAVLGNLQKAPPCPTGRAALRTPLLSLRLALDNYTHLTTGERTEIQ